MFFNSSDVPEPAVLVSFVVVNSKSEITGCLAITKLLLLKVIGKFKDKVAATFWLTELFKPVVVVLLGSTTAELECSELKVITGSSYWCIYGDVYIVSLEKDFAKTVSFAGVIIIW